MGPFELLQNIKSKDSKKSNDPLTLLNGTLIIGGVLMLIKLMFMVCGVESNNTEGEMTRRSKYKLHDGLQTSF